MPRAAPVGAVADEEPVAGGSSVGSSPPAADFSFIMVGAYDVPVVIEIADELAARIPGSRKRVFLSAAHMLNMERPAEFNKAVLDFLEAYPMK